MHELLAILSYVQSVCSIIGHTFRVYHILNQQRIIDEHLVTQTNSVSANCKIGIKSHCSEMLANTTPALNGAQLKAQECCISKYNYRIYSIISRPRLQAAQNVVKITVSHPSL